MILMVMLRQLHSSYLANPGANSTGFAHAAGEACLFVNDEPPVNLSSLNSRAGYHDIIPVQVTLKPGDVNTIKFGTRGSASKSKNPSLSLELVARHALLWSIY
jgi:hypothetical protein